MTKLLEGLKKSDLVELDLVTEPLEVYRVDFNNDHGVDYLFVYFNHRHNGRWGQKYNLDGHYQGERRVDGHPHTLDIVKVIKK